MKRYKIEVCLEMDGKNPPWSHMYEFEKSFADFLKAHGVQAERIDYPEGAANILSLFLTPIEQPVMNMSPTTGEPIKNQSPKKQSSPGKILKKLQKSYTK